MHITEIGTTQRTTWQECPVKHYHSFVMGEKGWGMTNKYEPFALVFGSIGHTGLHSWYSLLRSGEDPIKAAYVAEEMLKREVLEKIETWKSRGISVTEEGLDRQLALVTGFIQGYARYFTDDPAFQIEQVEWDFNIPAQVYYPPEVLGLNDEYALEDLPNIRGTIDLIISTKRGYVLIDHKFVGYPEMDLDTGVNYWPQPLSYCRAVEITFGPVDGYVHNQIRKPSRSLKPKWSTDDTLEDFEEFLERLRLEYIQYPEYTQVYPGRKKGYFLRSDVMKLKPSSRFLSEMLSADLSILRAYKTVTPARAEFCGQPPSGIPRNYGSCKKWGGHPCEYAQLCNFGYNPVTLGEFISRDKPHM